MTSSLRPGLPEINLQKFVWTLCFKTFRRAWDHKINDQNDLCKSVFGQNPVIFTHLSIQSGNCTVLE